ncbi:MAG: hypothetical protein ACI89U_003364 [Gammaproteobacteria bacterium]
MAKLQQMTVLYLGSSLVDTSVITWSFYEGTGKNVPCERLQFNDTDVIDV